jgi:hypothetical protein
MLQVEKHDSDITRQVLRKNQAKKFIFKRS